MLCTLISLFFTIGLSAAQENFHPADYKKTIAKCPAINRATGSTLSIDICEGFEHQPDIRSAHPV